MIMKFRLGSIALLVLACATAACGGSKEVATQPVATVTPPPAPTRGVFGPDACDADTQLPVAANAAYAVYFDSDGNLLDAPAEDLTGTSGNLMCATPPPDSEDPNDPVACRQGYCPRVLSGKQYCLRC